MTVVWQLIWKLWLHYLNAKKMPCCQATHQSEVGMYKCIVLNIRNLFQSFLPPLLTLFLNFSHMCCTSVYDEYRKQLYKVCNSSFTIFQYMYYLPAASVSAWAISYCKPLPCYLSSKQSVTNPCMHTIPSRAFLPSVISDKFVISSLICQGSCKTQAESTQSAEAKLDFKQTK